MDSEEFLPATLNVEKQRALDEELTRIRERQALAEQVSIADRIRETEQLAALALSQAAALPCFPGMVTEPQEIHRAVDLCAAAPAVLVDGEAKPFRASCPRWRNPRDVRCPRRTERDEAIALAEHLADCRIPGAYDAGGVKLLVRALWDGTWRGLPPPPHKPTPAEILFAHRGVVRDAQWRRIPATPLWETEPLAAVRQFLTRRPGTVAGHSFLGSEWGLFLGGEVGLAKTVAACAAALAGKVLFVSAPELVEFKPAVAPRDAREVPFLILDDLGTERDTESGHAIDVMVNLLTERQRLRRRTIVTTNLVKQARREKDPDGLRERYGERVFDRLLEGAVLVGVRGESYRKKEPK